MMVETVGVPLARGFSWLRDVLSVALTILLSESVADDAVRSGLGCGGRPGDGLIEWWWAIVEKVPEGH